MNERSPIQIKVRRFIRRMPQAPAGVRRARKSVRWTDFTDERAGRPWMGFSVRKTGPCGFSAREPPQEAKGKAEQGEAWEGEAFPLPGLAFG